MPFRISFTVLCYTHSSVALQALMFSVGAHDLGRVDPHACFCIWIWIWLFFPAIFVLVDRLLLSCHPALNLALQSIKSRARDVLDLTFAVTHGFEYQTG